MLEFYTLRVPVILLTKHDLDTPQPEEKPIHYLTGHLASRSNSWVCPVTGYPEDSHHALFDLNAVTSSASIERKESFIQPLCHMIQSSTLFHRSQYGSNDFCTSASNSYSVASLPNSLRLANSPGGVSLLEEAIRTGIAAHLIAPLGAKPTLFAFTRDSLSSPVVKFHLLMIQQARRCSKSNFHVGISRLIAQQ